MGDCVDKPEKRRIVAFDFVRRIRSQYELIRVLSNLISLGFDSYIYSIGTTVCKRCSRLEMVAWLRPIDTSALA